MTEDGTVVQELPWYAKCSLDDVRCFIGANLKTVARSVVAVGYYLKQVRDRELWKDAEDAGYLSVWDFASREFGISKSTASRYMSINDRFSEGGDSPLILEKYAELSKSQLQEMLYLTDQQADAVTQETTVQQIRAMRIPEPGPVEVLDGQMSISEFLDVVPETEEPETAEYGFIVRESAEDAGNKTMSGPIKPCVVAMDDLIPEEETAAAAVAISQQEGISELPSATDTNVGGMTDDTIYRAAAIDAVKKYFKMIKLNPEILVDSLITLPPAQPRCEEVPPEEVLGAINLNQASIWNAYNLLRYLQKKGYVICKKTSYRSEGEKE